MNSKVKESSSDDWESPLSKSSSSMFSTSPMEPHTLKCSLPQSGCRLLSPDISDYKSDLGSLETDYEDARMSDNQVKIDKRSVTFTQKDKQSDKDGDNSEQLPSTSKPVVPLDKNKDERLTTDEKLKIILAIPDEKFFDDEYDDYYTGKKRLDEMPVRNDVPKPRRSPVKQAETSDCPKRSGISTHGTASFVITGRQETTSLGSQIIPNDQGMDHATLPHRFESLTMEHEVTIESQTAATETEKSNITHLGYQDVSERPIPPAELFLYTAIPRATATDTSHIEKSTPGPSNVEPSHVLYREKFATALSSTERETVNTNVPVITGFDLVELYLQYGISLSQTSMVSENIHRPNQESITDVTTPSVTSTPDIQLPFIMTKELGVSSRMSKDSRDEVDKIPEVSQQDLLELILQIDNGDVCESAESSKEFASADPSTEYFTIEESNTDLGESNIGRVKDSTPDLNMEARAQDTSRTNDVESQAIPKMGEAISVQQPIPEEESGYSSYLSLSSDATLVSKGNKRGIHRKRTNDANDFLPASIEKPKSTTDIDAIDLSNTMELDGSDIKRPKVKSEDMSAATLKSSNLSQTEEPKSDADKKSKGANEDFWLRPESTTLARFLSYNESPQDTNSGENITIDHKHADSISRKENHDVDNTRNDVPNLNRSLTRQGGASSSPKPLSTDIVPNRNKPAIHRLNTKNNAVEEVQDSSENPRSSTNKAGIAGKTSSASYLEPKESLSVDEKDELAQSDVTVVKGIRKPTLLYDSNSFHVYRKHITSEEQAKLTKSLPDPKSAEHFSVTKLFKPLSYKGSSPKNNSVDNIIKATSTKQISNDERDIKIKLKNSDPLPVNPSFNSFWETPSVGKPMSLQSREQSKKDKRARPEVVPLGGVLSEAIQIKKAKDENETTLGKVDNIRKEHIPTKSAIQIKTTGSENTKPRQSGSRGSNIRDGQDIETNINKYDPLTKSTPTVGKLMFMQGSKQSKEDHMSKPKLISLRRVLSEAVQIKKAKDGSESTLGKVQRYTGGSLDNTQIENTPNKSAIQIKRAGSDSTKRSGSRGSDIRDGQDIKINRKKSDPAQVEPSSSASLGTLISNMCREHSKEDEDQGPDVVPLALNIHTKSFSQIKPTMSEKYQPRRFGSRESDIRDEKDVEISINKSDPLPVDPSLNGVFETQSTPSIEKRRPGHSSKQPIEDYWSRPEFVKFVKALSYTGGQQDNKNTEARPRRDVKINLKKSEPLPVDLSFDGVSETKSIPSVGKRISIQSRQQSKEDNKSKPDVVPLALNIPTKSFSQIKPTMSEKYPSRRFGSRESDIRDGKDVEISHKKSDPLPVDPSLNGVFETQSTPSIEKRRSGHSSKQPIEDYWSRPEFVKFVKRLSYTGGSQDNKSIEVIPIESASSASSRRDVKINLKKSEPLPVDLSFDGVSETKSIPSVGKRISIQSRQQSKEDNKSKPDVVPLALNIPTKSFSQIKPTMSEKYPPRRFGSRESDIRDGKDVEISLKKPDPLPVDPSLNGVFETQSTPSTEKRRPGHSSKQEIEDCWSRPEFIKFLKVLSYTGGSQDNKSIEAIPIESASSASSRRDVKINLKKSEPLPVDLSFDGVSETNSIPSVGKRISIQNRVQSEEDNKSKPDLVLPGKYLSFTEVSQDHTSIENIPIASATSSDPLPVDPSFSSVSGTISTPPIGKRISIQSRQQSEEDQRPVEPSIIGVSATKFTPSVGKRISIQSREQSKEDNKSKPDLVLPGRYLSFTGVSKDHTSIENIPIASATSSDPLPVDPSFSNVSDTTSTPPIGKRISIQSRQQSEEDQRPVEPSIIGVSATKSTPSAGKRISIQSREQSKEENKSKPDLVLPGRYLSFTEVSQDHTSIENIPIASATSCKSKQDAKITLEKSDPLLVDPSFDGVKKTKSSHSTVSPRDIVDDLSNSKDVLKGLRSRTRTSLQEQLYSPRSSTDDSVAASSFPGSQRESFQNPPDKAIDDIQYKNVISSPETVNYGRKTCAEMTDHTRISEAIPENVFDGSKKSTREAYLERRRSELCSLTRNITDTESSPLRSRTELKSKTIEAISDSKTSHGLYERTTGRSSVEVMKERTYTASSSKRTEDENNRTSLPKYWEKNKIETDSIDAPSSVQSKYDDSFSQRSHLECSSSIRDNDINVDAKCTVSPYIPHIPVSRHNDVKTLHKDIESSFENLKTHLAFHTPIVSPRVIQVCSVTSPGQLLGKKSRNDNDSTIPASSSGGPKSNNFDSDKGKIQNPQELPSIIPADDILQSDMASESPPTDTNRVSSVDRTTEQRIQKSTEIKSATKRDPDRHDSTNTSGRIRHSVNNQSKVGSEQAQSSSAGKKQEIGRREKTDDSHLFPYHGYDMDQIYWTEYTDSNDILQQRNILRDISKRLTMIAANQDIAKCNIIIFKKEPLDTVQQIDDSKIAQRNEVAPDDKDITEESKNDSYRPIPKKRTSLVNTSIKHEHIQTSVLKATQSAKVRRETPQTSEDHKVYAKENMDDQPDTSQRVSSKDGDASNKIGLQSKEYKDDNAINTIQHQETRDIGDDTAIFKEESKSTKASNDPMKRVLRRNKLQASDNENEFSPIKHGENKGLGTRNTENSEEPQRKRYRSPRAGQRVIPSDTSSDEEGTGQPKESWSSRKHRLSPIELTTDKLITASQSNLSQKHKVEATKAKETVMSTDSFDLPDTRTPTNGTFSRYLVNTESGKLTKTAPEKTEKVNTRSQSSLNQKRHIAPTSKVKSTESLELPNISTNVTISGYLADTESFTLSQTAPEKPSEKTIAGSQKRQIALSNVANALENEIPTNIKSSGYLADTESCNMALNENTINDGRQTHRNIPKRTASKPDAMHTCKRGKGYTHFVRNTIDTGPQEEPNNLHIATRTHDVPVSPHPSATTETTNTTNKLPKREGIISMNTTNSKMAEKMKAEAKLDQQISASPTRMQMPPLDQRSNQTKTLILRRDSGQKASQTTCTHLNNLLQDDNQPVEGSVCYQQQKPTSAQIKQRCPSVPSKTAKEPQMQIKGLQPLKLKENNLRTSPSPHDPPEKELQVRSLKKDDQVPSSKRKPIERKVLEKKDTFLVFIDQSLVNTEEAAINGENTKECSNSENIQPKLVAIKPAPKNKAINTMEKRDSYIAFIHQTIHNPFEKIEISKNNLQPSSSGIKSDGKDAFCKDGSSGEDKVKKEDTTKRQTKKVDMITNSKEPENSQEKNNEKLKYDDSLPSRAKRDNFKPREISTRNLGEENRIQKKTPTSNGKKSDDKRRVRQDVFYQNSSSDEENATRTEHTNMQQDYHVKFIDSTLHKNYEQKRKLKKIPQSNESRDEDDRVRKKSDVLSATWLEGKNRTDPAVQSKRIDEGKEKDEESIRKQTEHTTIEKDFHVKFIDSTLPNNNEQKRKKIPQSNESRDVDDRVRKKSDVLSATSTGKRLDDKNRTDPVVQSKRIDEGRGKHEDGIKKQTEHTIIEKDLHVKFVDSTLQNKKEQQRKMTKIQQSNESRDEDDRVRKKSDVLSSTCTDKRIDGKNRTDPVVQSKSIDEGRGKHEDSIRKQIEHTTIEKDLHVKFVDSTLQNKKEQQRKMTKIQQSNESRDEDDRVRKKSDVLSATSTGKRLDDKNRTDPVVQSKSIDEGRGKHEDSIRKQTERTTIEKDLHVKFVDSTLQNKKEQQRKMTKIQQSNESRDEDDRVRKKSDVLSSTCTDKRLDGKNRTDPVVQSKSIDEGRGKHEDSIRKQIEHTTIEKDLHVKFVDSTLQNKKEQQRKMTKIQQSNESRDEDDRVRKKSDVLSSTSTGKRLDDKNRTDPAVQSKRIDEGKGKHEDSLRKQSEHTTTKKDLHVKFVDSTLQNKKEQQRKMTKIQQSNESRDEDERVRKKSDVLSSTCTDKKQDDPVVKSKCIDNENSKKEGASKKQNQHVTFQKNSPTKSVDYTVKTKEKHTTKKEIMSSGEVINPNDNLNDQVIPRGNFIFRDMKEDARRNPAQYTDFMQKYKADYVAHILKTAAEVLKMQESAKIIKNNISRHKAEHQDKSKENVAVGHSKQRNSDIPSLTKQKDLKPKDVDKEPDMSIKTPTPKESLVNKGIKSSTKDCQFIDSTQNTAVEHRKRTQDVGQLISKDTEQVRQDVFFKGNSSDEDKCEKEITKRRATQPTIATDARPSLSNTITNRHGRAHSPIKHTNSQPSEVVIESENAILTRLAMENRDSFEKPNECITNDYSKPRASSAYSPTKHQHRQPRDVVKESDMPIKTYMVAMGNKDSYFKQTKEGPSEDNSIQKNGNLMSAASNDSRAADKPDRQDVVYKDGSFNEGKSEKEEESTEKQTQYTSRELNYQVEPLDLSLKHRNKTQKPPLINSEVIRTQKVATSQTNGNVAGGQSKPRASRSPKVLENKQQAIEDLYSSKSNILPSTSSDKKLDDARRSQDIFCEGSSSDEENRKKEDIQRRQTYPTSSKVSDSADKEDTYMTLNNQTIQSPMVNEGPIFQAPVVLSHSSTQGSISDSSSDRPKGKKMEFTMEWFNSLSKTTLAGSSKSNSQQSSSTDITNGRAIGRGYREPDSSLPRANAEPKLTERKPWQRKTPPTLSMPRYQAPDSSLQLANAEPKLTERKPWQRKTPPTVSMPRYQEPDSSLQLANAEPKPMERKIWQRKSPPTVSMPRYQEPDSSLPLANAEPKLVERKRWQRKSPPTVPRSRYDHISQDVTLQCTCRDGALRGQSFLLALKEFVEDERFDGNNTPISLPQGRFLITSCDNRIRFREKRNDGLDIEFDSRLPKIIREFKKHENKDNFEQTMKPVLEKLCQTSGVNYEVMNDLVFSKSKIKCALCKAREH